MLELVVFVESDGEWLEICDYEIATPPRVGLEFLLWDYLVQVTEVTEHEGYADVRVRYV